MKFNYIILLAVVFISSCSNNTTKIENEKQNLIVVSHSQFATNKMTFGEIQEKPFVDVVKCNGNIVAKSQGVAIISPFVAGLVKKVYVKVGDKVSENQALFEISGNDFIDIQREFSEIASKLKRLKSEFERKEYLFKQNVGSEKDFISAESEYKGVNASYSALKMKLQLMGLEPEKIEKAEFYRSYIINSPIDGYVSSLDVSLGQYAEQQLNMAEIINPNSLHVELNVFAKDISTLKNGQKVIFSLSGNSNVVYNATLYLIGKMVDDNSKTVQCYAEISDLDSVNFVNNSYIEAEIQTKESLIEAVPEESIVKSDGESYIIELVKDDNDNYYFNTLQVEVGRRNNGFVELLNDVKPSKILVKGAYNIGVE